MEADKFYFTKYYKGQVVNPYSEEENFWAARYWEYEKNYFEKTVNPEEEDFKDYMIRVIEHIADYFMVPFGEQLKTYFKN